MGSPVLHEILLGPGVDIWVNNSRKSFIRVEQSSKGEVCLNGAYPGIADIQKNTGRYSVAKKISGQSNRKWVDKSLIGFVLQDFSDPLLC